MKDEKMELQLNSIEKVIREGFERLNQRLAVLEAEFESNQERFDVFEEHIVNLVDDVRDIKKQYPRNSKQATY